MPDPQAPEIAALAKEFAASLALTHDFIVGLDGDRDEDNASNLTCEQSVVAAKLCLDLAIQLGWDEASESLHPIPIAPQETMREILKRADDKAKGWETNRKGLTENGHRYVREDIALAAIALGQSHSPATVERELVEALLKIDNLCSDRETPSFTTVVEVRSIARKALATASPPVDGEARK